ncbi:MAG TPA: hypothetical protein VF736_21080 [Pyrinomonadaceae bacterium]|jgi:hypothetical protein
MLKGQTTIGRVSARCPAGTEPLFARLRLARVLGGADLAPRGFPPRALLVIRRAKAARGVTLGDSAPRPRWEGEVREQVAALWRRAARPVRGRVPARAEAVIFEDEGEWMAALGLAAAAGESAAAHWCWRGRAEAAAPRGQTIVRAWAESPRFVPAALVKLARWGEAARVLGALSPSEAGALLSALRAEFELPRPAETSVRRDSRPGSDGRMAAAVNDRRRSDGGRDEEAAAWTAGVEDRAASHGDEGARGSRRALSSEAQSPPWGRWLAADGGACASLHAPARALLSFAAALFHAPALARSRDFAEEVFAFTADVDEAEQGERRPRAQSARHRDAARARSTSHNADGRRGATPAHAAPTGDSHDGRHAPDREGDSARVSRAHEAAGVTEEPESARPSPAAEGAARGARGAAEIVEAGEDASGADERVAPWRGIEGCETRLGGALFLLNLLAGLRLPECFDEECGLSEHVTGWGLTELFARALLGEECAGFEEDPLWGALAQLDGRAAGEPPAAALRVGEDYRAPARWLKLFAPREGDRWLFAEEGGRFALVHSEGFAVASLPLGELDAAALAARLADEYRVRGVRVPPLEEAPAGPFGGGLARPGVLRAALAGAADASLPFESLRAYGGARVPAGLRRLMGWTFPFLSYALRRSLADAGGEDGGAGESARELMSRPARLYCTATHVDLVLDASSVSFPARRSGLDASPGWVRDLMRVVAFHFE